jgi:hypothetical protein
MDWMMGRDMLAMPRGDVGDTGEVMVGDVAGCCGTAPVVAAAGSFSGDAVVAAGCVRVLLLCLRCARLALVSLSLRFAEGVERWCFG